MEILVVVENTQLLLVVVVEEFFLVLEAMAMLGRLETRLEAAVLAVAVAV
jgi:hypothetical protein